MAKKRLQQATATATTTEFERIKEEEYSHVERVIKHGLENKKLRLETEIATNKVCLLEHEVVRLTEKARFLELDNEKARLDLEAAKDQVRLLSENQQKLELDNEKLQRFLKRVIAGRLESATNESLAVDIAAPMVSPLSSKNKNSSPSTSPALELSPNTDSVDATIGGSPTVAADFYCEPNISFESNSGDESDISTMNDSIPPQTKKEITKQYILQIFESLTPKDTEAERRKKSTALFKQFEIQCCHVAINMIIK